jgi:hypothetical protein
MRWSFIFKTAFGSAVLGVGPRGFPCPSLDDYRHRHDLCRPYKYRYSGSIRTARRLHDCGCTETITTNPLLNTYYSALTPSILGTYGLNNWSNGSGALYTITTTVNGITYTQTESDPFVTHSYSLNGLTPPVPTPSDQVVQQIDSQRCVSNNGALHIPLSMPTAQLLLL